MSVARIWLETVTEYMSTRGLSMSLAKEAQSVLSRVPDWWNTSQGDGRGRGGRESVWPVSDIILTVKVSSHYSITGNTACLFGPQLALNCLECIVEAERDTNQAEMSGRTLACDSRKRQTLSRIMNTADTKCMYKRDVSNVMYYMYNHPGSQDCGM